MIHINQASQRRQLILQSPNGLISWNVIAGITATEMSLLVQKIVVSTTDKCGLAGPSYCSHEARDTNY